MFQPHISCYSWINMWQSMLPNNDLETGLRYKHNHRSLNRAPLSSPLPDQWSYSHQNPESKLKFVAWITWNLLLKTKNVTNTSQQKLLKRTKFHKNVECRQLSFSEMAFRPSSYAFSQSNESGIDRKKDWVETESALRFVKHIMKSMKLWI